MSQNFIRRSIGIVGMMALLIGVLLLTACGGAATPTAASSTPTQEAAQATAMVTDTPIIEEKPQATAPPAEEATEESETSEDTEPAAQVSDQSDAAAECVPADPNTDPIAGAILFLDEYIDAGQINEGISPVTDADWAKGPSNAPVTIIEFGDFQ